VYSVCVCVLYSPVSTLSIRVCACVFVIVRGFVRLSRPVHRVYLCVCTRVCVRVLVMLTLAP
jgi:hypothetical protein